MQEWKAGNPAGPCKCESILCANWYLKPITLMQFKKAFGYNYQLNMWKNLTQVTKVSEGPMACKVKITLTITKMSKINIGVKGCYKGRILGVYTVCTVPHLYHRAHLPAAGPTTTTSRSVISLWYKILSIFYFQNLAYYWIKISQ